MYRTVLISIFILTICQVGVSQDTLTLDQALEVALKNNFLIQTLKNKAEIASLNNTPGNAGMLPKASANFTGSNAASRINEHSPAGTFSNTATSYIPSATVTWTLFDGLRMFATKGLLRELDEIGALDFKDTLQTVVAQVIDAYYDIVSSVQQLNGLNKALEVSNERVTIADKQFQVGTISEVDLLQAKVDLNEQKSLVLSQESLILQKKIALNTLLARSPELQFCTTDSIPVNYNVPMLSTAELESRNFQLIAAYKNLEVARFAKREAVSQFFPLLSISGSYGLTQLQNSTATPAYEQSYGLSGGVELTVPIFNGFNTVNQVKIASADIANAQIALDNTKLQTVSKVYQARQDFERAKTVLQLEEENIGLANKNLKIALERFRVGESTAIEMRTAEESYVAAVARLVAARFNAKSDETELMRLQSELVK